MINFSVSLRKNPNNQDAAMKAYASAQYTTVMDLPAFAKHISTHGCVYSRADVQAILTLAVDCIREQLLLGQRIQLGELGTFFIGLKSKPADTIADFTAQNIKAVSIKYAPGENFEDMLKDAEFNQVITRKSQKAALAEAKK